MTKGTLYSILGVLGLSSVGLILWKVLAPVKPATAAAAAGDIHANNPNNAAPASGTPAPGSNSNTGINANTPAASTNINYTVVDGSKWGSLKVGDKLAAESETALYKKSIGSSDNQILYYVKKGDYVGQILSLTTTAMTVRNWKIPEYTDDEVEETIFYAPMKSYRKLYS